MSAALGIWLVRAQDEILAAALHAQLGGELYRPWFDATTPKAQFVAAYHRHAQWIMIAATGIAVRFLDGLVQDKHSDPALVVVDAAGRYAVALLAGHEGGANCLAYRIANAVGAVPVITTASEALKPLVIGIGCRKDVSAARIEVAVRKALGARRLDEVREIATVDIKAEEPGLREFCAQQGLPLRVFARAALAARPWVTQASDWVQQNLGLDGVCEPCALLACTRGSLLVPKLSFDGVAVAVVADQHWTAGT